MAFDFPNSPSEGHTYTPVGGPQWVYTGGVWKMLNAAQVGTAEARNRLVNPCFQISQEWGNALTGMGSPIAYYAADQWSATWSVAPGAVEGQRVQVITPNGSRDRIRLTVGTANAALAAADYMLIQQPIEGIRVTDFRYGLASAKQSVLRFGWKSPAGTYTAAIQNITNTRAFLANFTVTAGQANTDTEHRIIIPGDVTGAWLTDTSTGMVLSFTMAGGSNHQGIPGWQSSNVYVTSSTSNGMAVAGAVYELFDVGLYLDPNATGTPPPWQMPDEAQELLTCQRYWQTFSVTDIHYSNASQNSHATWSLTTAMRIPPAVTFQSITAYNSPGPASYNTDTQAAGVYYGANSSAPAGASFTFLLNARM